MAPAPATEPALTRSASSLYEDENCLDGETCITNEEASGIMGCPVKTVSTRLFRARQRFRAAVANIIKV